MPFTATYMKGRGNYLCLHRFEALRDSVASGTGFEFSRAAGNAYHVQAIDEWSRHTETGDRAEIEDLPEDLPFWNDIAATTENCIGTECPRYQDCFVVRMRQRAAESDVVIVNHHLLCADAAVRQSEFGEVIPNCRFAVVDEAHQLEDVATQYFGLSISNYRLDDFARDVRRILGTGPLDRAGRDRARMRTGSRARRVTFLPLCRCSGTRCRARGPRQTTGCGCGAAIRPGSRTKAPR